MAKGYILVEEVPKTCEYCEFYDWCFCKAILRKPDGNSR